MAVWAVFCEPSYKAMAMRIGYKNHDQPASDLDNIRILERRIEWLDEKIKKAKKSKYSAHFDISERDALRWAIETIKNWVDLPNVEDKLKDF